MKFSRRDLLMWGAGAAAGLIVTPVPWKILDDTSKWSQNWPWIPQAARVPIDTKMSACTLCPNGCAVRVRMAAGWPVGVAGTSTHPLSRGALCPLAFGAHQLNWHPQRLRRVRHRGNASSWNEAQASFAKAKGEGPIIVVDAYPGRAASSVLQRFAEKQGGSYRVVHGTELRALQPYATWTGVPATSLGYDLENARTILSFGVPLLDGWGIPGRFTHLWAERAARNSDPHLRLIQVESSLSRTASRACQWIAIREGSESALASGMARVLMEQNLVPVHGPTPAITLAAAADQTGLSAQTVIDLAGLLVTHGPTLVISRDNNPAAAALNLVLGSIGTPGGIVRRSQNKQPCLSADDALASARAVLIDSSVPWGYTPQVDAEVFRFAAWDGGPTRADWLLPAPGFLEELSDVPSAPTSGVDTYGVAPNLVKPLAEVQSAAQFVAGLDSSLISFEKVIHNRCAELFHKRSGTLCGKEQLPVAELPSVEKLEEQLWNGAVWVGEASPPGALKAELKEWPHDVPPARAAAWSSDWNIPVLPPLASKLFVESELRQPSERRNA